MKKATVICDMFIGDSLMGSSVCEEFKKTGMYDFVRYLIRLPQPLELLRANPYIDEVFLIGQEAPIGHVHRLEHCTWHETPPKQWKGSCGILAPSTGFSVYIPDEAKNNAKLQVDELRAQFPNLPIVAYQSNWEEKSFLFTREQYEAAIDVHLLGFGGKHRNIEKILSLLEDFVLVEVGGGNGVSQMDPSLASSESYTQTAAIIQQCDFFIGSEGGLSNLSAGIGTSTIITTDFIAQLYGRKGVIKQLAEVALGPCCLFPDNLNHHHLSEYLTDEEVATSIHQIISEQYAAEAVS